MKRALFAALLRRIADGVESGDSAEGNIMYTFSESDPGEVDVDVRVRTGNLDGQGGMTIINTMPNPVPIIPTEGRTCEFCGKPLDPFHPAVYCNNDCALRDA